MNCQLLCFFLNVQKSVASTVWFFFFGLTDDTQLYKQHCSGSSRAGDPGEIPFTG